MEDMQSQAYKVADSMNVGRSFDYSNTDLNAGTDKPSFQEHIEMSKCQAADNKGMDMSTKVVCAPYKLV